MSHTNIEVSWCSVARVVSFTVKYRATWGGVKASSTMVHGRAVPGGNRKHPQTCSKNMATPRPRKSTHSTQPCYGTILVGIWPRHVLCRLRGLCDKWSITFWGDLATTPLEYSHRLFFLCGCLFELEHQNYRQESTPQLYAHLAPRKFRSEAAHRAPTRSNIFAHHFLAGTPQIWRQYLLRIRRFWSQ